MNVFVKQKFASLLKFLFNLKFLLKKHKCDTVHCISLLIQPSFLFVFFYGIKTSESFNIFNRTIGIGKAVLGREFA